AARDRVHCRLAGLGRLARRRLSRVQFEFEVIVDSFRFGTCVTDSVTHVPKRILCQPQIASLGPKLESHDPNLANHALAALRRSAISWGRTCAIRSRLAARTASA